MNYKKANEILTGRNQLSKKLANNTYLIRDGENIAVKLHQTNVLTFKPNGDVILNTDGWLTVTTKARINNYLPNGFYLSQEKSVWYLSSSDKRYLYADNCVITKRGAIKGCKTQDPKKDKLLKKIDLYANKYAKAFIQGKISAPSGGDCWGCSMRDKNGNTAMGSYHLLQHIKENYFVPSLLVNACNDIPTSIFIKGLIGTIWYQDKNLSEHYSDILKNNITKNVKRYLKRNLNFAS